MIMIKLNILDLRQNNKEVDNSYFNILVIHQNRFKGIYNGVPRAQSIWDDFIPSFFNLVVWGHEHESIPIPKEVAETGVHILQPGSTVATSIIDAESKQKHCFLLQVYKTNYKLTPIPLKWTRPLIFSTKILHPCKTGINLNDKEKIDNYIFQAIKNLISKIDYTNVPENFKKPLVRLKIENSSCGVIKSYSLSQMLKDIIANPADCLQFYNKKEFKPQKIMSESTKISLDPRNKDYIENCLKSSDCSTFLFNEKLTNWSK